MEVQPRKFLQDNVEVEHRKFLQENIKTLADKVDIDLVVPYLYCQDVLSSYDVEFFNYSGWGARRLMVIDLCHMVSRRGPEAFFKFMLALSVLQPDLFKDLCGDGLTTMQQELLLLEQRFLEEMEMSKREALLLNVRNKTLNLPSEASVSSKDVTLDLASEAPRASEAPTNPGDGVLKSSSPGLSQIASKSDQNLTGGATPIVNSCVETDMIQLQTESEHPEDPDPEPQTNDGSPVITIIQPRTVGGCERKNNEEQLPPAGCEVKVEIGQTETGGVTKSTKTLTPLGDIGQSAGCDVKVEIDQTETAGATHCTEMLNRVEDIGQPLMCSSPKRQKLSPKKSNLEKRGAEEQQGEKGVSTKTIVQMGKGNKSMKIYRGDIGPDQIRRDPRLERGERSDTFTPKTVYPLSLKRYILSGRTVDGEDYVKFKSARTRTERSKPSVRLNKEQWGRLSEFVDIIFVTHNMIVREREVSLTLHLTGGLFLTICPTTGTIDLRKYIAQGTNPMAVATSEGVGLNTREWRNLVMHRDRINRNHFNQEGSEDVECWLAGRHTEFLGPLKCPDCGYLRDKGVWNIHHIHSK